MTAQMAFRACTVPVFFSLAATVNAQVECDAEQLIQSRLPKLEVLQKKADAHDAKFLKSTRAKMAELAKSRGWSKREVGRIYAKARAKLVSDVSDRLAELKKMDPSACAKIKQTGNDILRADDRLYFDAWRALESYLDEATESSGK